MRGRVTMKEVAALAGVGLKTVSRVVNGEPGVSDDTAQRVQNALHRLDYRHNLAASQLRRGHKTASIGVLLQDVSNSFSAGFLRAVEDAAQERGVVVLSASLDESEDRERRLVQDFMSRRIDGLIVMPTNHDHSYLQNDMRAGVAVVLVDRPTFGLDADTVMVDNRGAARCAVEHLLSQGHRSVAFIGDRQTIVTAHERRLGFVDALADSGYPVDEALVRVGVRSAEEAARATVSLLAGDSPPTAIFAARNEITVGVAHALRDLGLGHDIAVVGFDDFPLADLLDPPITVVLQDVVGLGRTAAEMLFSRLDGDTSPTQRVIMPAVVAPRGSGEISPRRC